MFNKLYAVLLYLGIFQPSVAAPIQIPTINERGPANACGHWAISNATALVNKLGAIQAADKAQLAQVAVEAQQCGKAFVPTHAHQLSTEEIESLAKKAGIICFVLGKYPNGQVAPLIWNGSGDITPYEKIVAKYNKMLSNDEATFAIPCICNVGGHWVMLAVVKLEAQKPFLVFMDNCNGPGTRVQPFVNYLKKLFAL